MEEKNYHIKLGIDKSFLGLPFAEKLKTEAAEKGLLIDVEPEPSNWNEKYRHLNAPHRDSGLFTIEILPAFFSDTAHEQTLFGLIENYIRVIKDSMNKKGLGLKKIIELLRLRPLCVYYLQQEDRVHFTYDLYEDSKQFRLQWEKMSEILLKVLAKNRKTRKWLDSIARQKENMTFLQFEETKNEWVLINRLLYACSALSEDYRSRLDDPRLG